jgi:Uma2 family endonuclease
MSIAIATTWEERMADLGHVPSPRVLKQPKPGTATLGDVLRARSELGKLCELVDGTLVEKAMGWQESVLAGVLLQWLNNYLDQHRLGVATGPDGLTRLFGDTVRGPDVAFVAWDRLPEGKLPRDPIPDLVPNLVIEVLCAGNTYLEMSRKRREYFHAGVQLLWMVDPEERSVAVYRSPQDVQVLHAGEVLAGDAVLPGWQVDIGALFSKLDSRFSG